MKLSAHIYAATGGWDSLNACKRTRPTRIDDRDQLNIHITDYATMVEDGRVLRTR